MGSGWPATVIHKTHKIKVSCMNENHSQTPLSTPPAAVPADPSQDDVQTPSKPQEYGGPKGLEPTRYGDWEKAGRCIDF